MRATPERMLDAKCRGGRDDTSNPRFNALGFVLVMEAPGHEYTAARTFFWSTMTSWRSNANPGLATMTFYAGAFPMCEGD